MKTAFVSLVVLTVFCTAVQASPMIISLYGDIWDIDLATGAATNKRPAAVDDQYVIDITKAGAFYYTMTAQGSDTPSTLAIVDPATAALTYIGVSGVGGMIEGDMAYSPDGNCFYALNQVVSSTTHKLIRIDLGGTASVVGTLPDDTDYSGLSFDGNGNLWVLENWNKKLLRVSTTDASVLGNVTLNIGSVNLGDAVGMDYDPASGKMYLVGGTVPALYTVNLATGDANLVGSTGLPAFTYVAGLTVPEPCTLGLLAVSAAGLILRRRRRQSP